MSARWIVRGSVGLLLVWSGMACRDVGIVGEGSACAEVCGSTERCLNGACVPIRGGDAGDDSDRFDERPGGHDDGDHGGRFPPDEDHLPRPSD